MSDDINETLGIENKGNPSSQPKRQIHQTETHFKTLLGYGKFISGLGWTLIFIGALLIFFAITALGNL